jgi:biopolymer transport protein ExbB
MKRITLVFASALFAFGAGTAGAQDEDAASLSELLNLIQQGQARDSQEARQRESRFAQQRNQQQNLLNRARAERTRLENESARLEQTFEENQRRILAARTQLEERLGDLKELFGVLQTVAGDTQGRFEASLTNLQYPDRSDFLVELGNKMASATELAKIEDIETLWYELQRELTESGKVVRFNHAYTTAGGEQLSGPIVRIGTFNIVNENGYLEYKENGSVQELPRQPEGRFLGSANDVYDAAPGEIVAFGLDGTRGGILGLLVDTPTLGEKVDQGGIVGYSIITLGIIGLLIAIWRWLGLSAASRKVSAQLKSATPSTDNPLGRVLAAYESNKDADTETIELKLSEAGLKEMPGLTKGLLFIKVISVVAPLMGLLGTVTGMIKTFQVITLYGAGDPKMMAGGISQALVTTVLGLVVAIPMVLLHTIVSGSSRKVINVIQSQSAGIIAQHSETHN